jgi:hypothetical protein
MCFKLYHDWKRIKVCKQFLCPAIKWLLWPGHIVLPCSVLLSSSVSVHYLSNFCTHSTQIWHIDIKKIQVKFEFGHGQMIFDRVMPHDEIFSFRSLSPQWYFTFNSNLTYRYVKGMRRSSSNLVIIRWFFAELCPLNFEKRKFSVSVHYLPNSCTYSFQI